MHDSALIAEQRASRIQACHDAGLNYTTQKCYHMLWLMCPELDEDGEEVAVLTMPILFCWN